MGLFGHFYSHLSFLSSSSLWETARYRLKYCLKGLLNPKQPTNGPLRQYFSLYRAGSKREGERGEKRIDREKMSKQPPPAPAASAVGPCPTIIQIVGRPGTGSFEPSHHPTTPGKNRCCGCFQLGHLNDQLFWKELFICFTACVFVNV